MDSTGKEAQGDFFVSHYPACSKKFAWRAGIAVPCKAPVAYPKGQVQIWHVCEEGFPDAMEGKKKLLALVPKEEKTKTKVESKKRPSGHDTSKKGKKLKQEVKIKKEIKKEK